MENQTTLQYRASGVWSQVMGFCDVATECVAGLRHANRHRKRTKISLYTTWILASLVLPGKPQHPVYSPGEHIQGWSVRPMVL